MRKNLEFEIDVPATGKLTMKEQEEDIDENDCLAPDKDAVPGVAVSVVNLDPELGEKDDKGGFLEMDTWSAEKEAVADARKRMLVRAMEVMQDQMDRRQRILNFLQTQIG